MGREPSQSNSGQETAVQSSTSSKCYTVSRARSGPGPPFAPSKVVFTRAASAQAESSAHAETLTFPAQPLAFAHPVADQDAPAEEARTTEA